MKIARILLALFLATSMSACMFLVPAEETQQSSQPVSDSSLENQSTMKNESSFGWDPLTATTEGNTSGRVDEIAFKAFDDAESISEDQAELLWTEAVKYLQAHCDNFYESNEIMEKSMYYGYFLYKYIEKNAVATTLTELPDSVRTVYDAGYNSVEAIKYVYREIDAIESEATQNALSEAQEALRALDSGSADIKSPSESLTEDDGGVIPFPDEENLEGTTYSATQPEARQPTDSINSLEGTTSAPPVQEVPQISSVQSEPSNSNLVWVPTRGGTKYHRRAGCSNMIEPIQMPLEEAAAAGFSACGRCY